MRNVSALDLKEHLHAYLTYAESGEEIVIRDENRPVAKLVPFPSPGPDDADEVSAEAAALLTPFDPVVDATREEREMAADGTLRLPLYKWKVEAHPKLPRAMCIDGPDGDLAVRAVLEEREESL